LTLPIAELTTLATTRQGVVATTWCEERVGDVFRAVSPVQDVTITASRAAEVIEVHANVSGRFGFDCSRCAEPGELTVDTEFDHHFVGPGQLDAGDAIEGGAADFDADPDVSEHDGVRIDLDELCIEHTILALPVVPLCHEDCRGLCPTCGCNKNREACLCAAQPERASPWASLQDLKLEPKA